MTDTNNKDGKNNAPRKTLSVKSGGTLSPRGGSSSNKLKSFSNNTTSNRTVKVEIKRSKHRNVDIDTKDLNYLSSGHLTETEKNARIEALRKAKENITERKSPEVKAEEAKIAEQTKENISEKVSRPPETKPAPNYPKPNQFDKSKVESPKVESKPPLKVEKKKSAKDLEEEDKKFKLDLKSADKRKKKKIRDIDLDNYDVLEDGLNPRKAFGFKRNKFKEEKVNKKPEKLYREVNIPDYITVQELAAQMSEKSSVVISELIKLGIMATINQSIDADTAELVVTALGHEFKRTSGSDVEKILDSEEDKEEDLQPRSPIVTVMGHVDHGKTSLLDALKSTNVVDKEAGGITQHIGAYQVKMNNRFVTFLDTPGHEAFSEMRSRGAEVTDIVVLVVAADDGIMAQTVEAINHAKAAKVPIIVAINKIDKPEANITKVKNELLNYELVSEDLGGDTLIVEVSAKQKINLDKLIDTIFLQAEMLELKANPKKLASGYVIESKVDKGRGIIVSLLVQQGTLNIGDLVVAGTAYGKIRALINDHGKKIKNAGPSVPVEVLGLSETPLSGEKFGIVETERQARDIVDYRKHQIQLKNNASVKKTTLQNIFSESEKLGKVKQLSLILKGDVQGSVEAIIGSLAKITHEEIEVKVIHNGVGGVNESDVSLARASNAIIIGFNVRANKQARDIADANGIDIRYYSIIYDLIDDIRAIASGLLDPIKREEYLGSATVKQVFNLSKFGKIAGCIVSDGLIKRGARVRLLRDNVVIHEGTLKTLRRFKDDVKEVKQGYECGAAFTNYEDLKEGDVIEASEIVEEIKKL